MTQGGGGFLNEINGEMIAEKVKPRYKMWRLAYKIEWWITIGALKTASYRTTAKELWFEEVRRAWEKPREFDELKRR